MARRRVEYIVGVAEQLDELELGLEELAQVFGPGSLDSEGGEVDGAGYRGWARAARPEALSHADRDLAIAHVAGWGRQTARDRA